jgi:hypothetical protein
LSAIDTSAGENGGALAQTLGIWAAVAASAAGFRRRPALAIGASVTLLAVGVVTFYVGL